MTKLSWIICLWGVLAFGETLSPVGAGVPEELSGEVSVEQQDGLLWLKARIAEPGGKVLARSIGKNPVWEKDALESPPLEDQVRWVLHYQGESGAGRTVEIEVNPWGAYRIEERGEVLLDIDVATTSDVTESGWSAEAAVPVASLKPDWNSPQVRLHAERIRSRRALAPEFRWRTALDPVILERSDNTRLPELPNRFGNTDRPVQIGRVDRLPPLVADWDSPSWQDVPAFDLPRNEPYPRAPWRRTEVRWVHDGTTLALLARMEEPEPVVARAGGRDSSVLNDDHLAIYLATSGSKFIQIATNTVGALLDTVGSGPRMMRPRSGWNGNIERKTDIRHGYWTAAIRIPLDECAAALDETGVPREWRVLVARYRAARPGESAESSTLPVMGGTTTFHGPARYREMVLRDEGPSHVRLPQAVRAAETTGLAGELAALDPHVWTPLYRRFHSVRTMVQDYLRKKVKEAVLAERHAWAEVDSREAWERFRDERIKDLRKSVGEFPPARPPLEARITARHEGDGYRQENLVWQSRPGLWMTANLYLPANPSPPFPAIMIVPSQHYPKTQIELHDMGELWARTGAAVLIIERLGYGERTETTPWFRQGYGSRFNLSKQLFLVGESYSGWLAWDVIRSVDFLYGRPEIDRDRIILLGAVAGGGEIAGVAAALDPRITAVVPFNYDQGHVRVHGDSPGQIAGQFSPWLISASVAPRKFVRAFEFGWEGAEEPDYPSLWVDGMLRSKKVWGFYDAEENLAAAQGYGLIRLSMEAASHCTNIGPQQREELYPIFKRWFGIPYPDEAARSILPHSQLTSRNPVREAARKQEAGRRRPNAEFLSLPPAVSAELERKAMHQLAFEMGVEQLEAARSRRERLDAGEKAMQLRKELKIVLGDIEPPTDVRAESLWKRALSGAEVEGLSLTVEEGIRVPMLVIRPSGQESVPLVVAVAHSGKERFLTDRSKEIESLVRAGIAVCLPDLRATGETAPTRDRGDGGTYQWIAQTEFDLGQSLLGSRLKDLRAVLTYLRQRSDVDADRLALWGDSFSPHNPKNLWLDELHYEGGPQIQYRAEPMGAHLAMLGALYEDDVRVVAARGGLAGYLSALENAFTYVPAEDILLGALAAGDMADVAAMLAPRPLLIEGLVNGRNIRPEPDAVESAFNITRSAYDEAGAAGQLVVRSEPRDVTSWLQEQLGYPRRQ